MRNIIYYKRDLEDRTCRLEVRLESNVQQMSGKHLPPVLPSEANVGLRWGWNPEGEISLKDAVPNYVGLSHKYMGCTQIYVHTARGYSWS